VKRVAALCGKRRLPASRQKEISSLRYPKLTTTAAAIRANWLTIVATTTAIASLLVAGGMLLRILNGP